MTGAPEYLSVPASDLGRGTNVQVVIKTDMASIGQAMAEEMFSEILGAREKGRGATLIVPVGPVEGFALLAEKINRTKVSIRDDAFINMDEYLDDADEWLPAEHPLSFREFMQRAFYDRLDPALAPRMENRIFPDPDNLDFIPKLIEARGGLDSCLGGIGINGHIAFNEPPEPSEQISDADFVKLPTRVLSLSRETRTINSVTVGGDIGLIPKRAVTVGMKEILGARKLRLYCNRPWQSGVVRRALHGPVTAACPASFMRQHSDARLTVADYVATPPQIGLR